MTLNTQSVQAYFDEKLETIGPNAKGLDYRDEKAQVLRFQQLLKLLPEDPNTPFSLNDYGCGYGGFYDYLVQRGYNHLDYSGYDISQAMIRTAQQLHPEKSNCQFQVIPPQGKIPPQDYTVACAIFNVKLDNTDEVWLQFILDTLNTCNEASRKGFGFNLLTRYSDADKMVNKLYYADPCFLFDHCKRNYAKDVALLHDYGLYDFTMLVRKLV